MITSISTIFPRFSPCSVAQRYSHILIFRRGNADNLLHRAILDALLRCGLFSQRAPQGFQRFSTVCNCENSKSLLRDLCPIWASRLSTMSKHSENCVPWSVWNSWISQTCQRSVTANVGSRRPSPQLTPSLERVGRTPQQLEELPLSSSCSCSAKSLHISANFRARPLPAGVRGRAASIGHRFFCFLLCFETVDYSTTSAGHCAPGCNLCGEKRLLISRKTFY